MNLGIASLALISSNIFISCSTTNKTEPTTKITSLLNSYNKMELISHSFNNKFGFSEMFTYPDNLNYQSVPLSDSEKYIGKDNKKQT